MLSNVDGEGTTPGSIFIELLPRITLNRTRSLMLGGLCPPSPLGFNAFLPKQRIELQTRQEEHYSMPAPTSASAPETALGSCPHVALSSVQANMDHNTRRPILVNRKITQTKISVIGLCSLVKIHLWKEVKKLNFQSSNPSLGAFLVPNQK